MAPDTGDVLVADDYTDVTATFGDRLSLARETSGLGQAQLAHRIGVKLQTLRSWEEDRSEPRANRLQMLAGMLNVSMVWLMSGQGHAPAARPAAANVDANLLAELRSLRVDQAQIVERMVRLEQRLLTTIA
jgi:transcriptional regulator with XRE-family HTH domain